MRHSMLLFLAIVGIACAGGNRAGSVTAAAAVDDLQTQSTATTVQSFTADEVADLMARLEADLAADVRESIAYAFRELLLNAIEWGGQLDATRQVRIACLHSPRMLMYRIADPGPGFRIEDLPHAAIGQPSDQPIEHVRIREEKGIRPGGFGLLTVRASVDELLYNEKRNEVVFVKYL